MQIGAALQRPLLGLLRIGLDDAAAGPHDLAECRGDRGGGDALAAVLRAGEDAADPPVRRIGGPSVVGSPVLDVGEFQRRAELALADAAITGVDEHLVDRSARHVPALRLPVSFPGVPGTDALRWNPMHQQPPHTPLLASTSAAKSSQVSGVSIRVVNVIPAV